MIRTLKDDVLLTRNQAAEMLSVSLTTIGTWTKKGYLKAYRVGKKVYFKKLEILESMKSS